MRLFTLEIKRVLKSRRALILLALALVFSVIMAFLPISFEGINRPNDDGTVSELDGLEAIRFKQPYYREAAGEITPQGLADALRIYQKYVHEYGSTNDIPLKTYIENIMAIRPMIKGLSEAFGDPKTGAGADLMDIDPDDVESLFYEKCASHLSDVMRLEQKDYPSAERYAAGKYSEVARPFYQFSGISRDAFDYTSLYILLLGIICIAITAPLFAGEYQNGSDSILRCTKHGRGKLAVTRILAGCFIFAVVFFGGMGIHLAILDCSFGMESLKTSFQMLYSIISLPNINVGQLQIILTLAGFLTVLATVSFTLFLSARCRDSVTVLLISIATLLLPIIAYGVLSGSWILSILPTSGVGLKNSFLYQLCDFNFVHIGSMSFWTPIVIMISAAVEIPLFLGLAIHTYCKHQVV